MQNIKLVIAYDGSSFLGWQKTEMGPSIEESLQLVLEKILQQPVELQAASRTDAGVHARGQVVNFFSKKEISDFSTVQRSLNKLLPSAISVLQLHSVPLEFHPTLDCTSKQYRYYFCLDSYQLPQNRAYSWHCPYKLDFAAMRQAAAYFEGEKDFTALCTANKKSAYEHHVRRLDQISIHELPQSRLCIHMEGNRFLYKMARTLAGTLFFVGLGRLAVDEIPHLLAQQKRSLAGPTAPAHGLFLHQVTYG